MANLNTIGGIHYEIMKRCYNEKSVMYNCYGVKGIEVCEEWHNRENFKQWAYSSGYKKGFRLLRYDNSKNYEPTNCFWDDSPLKKQPNGTNQLNKARIKHNKEIKSELGVTNYQDHRLYSTFHGMHTRCENPNHIGYKYYGALGVKVCKEWSGKDGFKNFLRWVIKYGTYQRGLTLDRKNPFRGYSPSNCRWVTWKEQANNKRKNYQETT